MSRLRVLGLLLIIAFGTASMGQFAVNLWKRSAPGELSPIDGSSNVTTTGTVSAGSVATTATTAGGVEFSEAVANGTSKVRLQAQTSRSADITVEFPDVSGTVMGVTGSAVDTHGALLWGDSSDPFDTGTEVCAARGLTCVDVKTITGTDSACGTDQGAATTHFYALCK